MTNNVLVLFSCVSFRFSCHSPKVSLFWLPSAYLWFNYKLCLDTVLNLFLIYNGILYHNGRTLPTKSQNKEHLEIGVVIITRARKFPDFQHPGKGPTTTTLALLWITDLIFFSHDLEGIFSSLLLLDIYLVNNWSRYPSSQNSVVS